MAWAIGCIFIALGVVLDPLASASAIAKPADVYNLNPLHIKGRSKVLNGGAPECEASFTANNMILCDADCVKRIMPPNYNEETPYSSLDVLRVRMLLEDETNSTYGIYSILKIFFFKQVALVEIEPTPQSTNNYPTPEDSNYDHSQMSTNWPLLDPSTLKLTSFLKQPESPSLEDYFDDIPKLNESYNFVVQIIKVQGAIKEHICDGSIIARDVVLSAAECLNHIIPRDNMKETPHYLIMDLRVKIGDDEMSQYEVTRIILHDYLILLKLKTQAPEDTSLVELLGEEPEKFFLKPTLLTRGVFGRFLLDDDDDEVFHDITPIVNILTVPQGNCLKTIVTNSSFICAKQMVNDIEPMTYCPTHLGGPVMIGERQVGVTTFLRRHGPWEHCFSGNKYEGYPSVISARDWIDSNIQLLREDRDVTDPNDFDVHVVP